MAETRRGWSEPKTRCGVTYRWNTATGAIEVNGKLPSYKLGGNWEKRVQKIWDKYKDIIVENAAKFELPVAWVLAVLAIESGGNEWGCSKCISHLPDGRQWCAMAPNCGGGVAKDGKTYSCCAYGLMQIIDSEARKHGMKHGAELLGNASDSLRIGVEIIEANRKRHKGDPIRAVKAYNGGSHNCGQGGIFGIGGQGNYVEKFARVANMAAKMDLVPPQPAAPPVSSLQVKQSGFPFGAVMFAGALAWSGWHLAKTASRDGLRQRRRSTA